MLLPLTWGPAARRRPENHKSVKPSCLPPHTQPRGSGGFHDNCYLELLLNPRPRVFSSPSLSVCLHQSPHRADTELLLPPSPQKKCGLPPRLRPEMAALGVSVKNVTKNKAAQPAAAREAPLMARGLCTGPRGALPGRPALPSESGPWHVPLPSRVARSSTRGRQAGQAAPRRAPRVSSEGWPSRLPELPEWTRRGPHARASVGARPAHEWRRRVTCPPRAVAVASLPSRRTRVTAPPRGAGRLRAPPAPDVAAPEATSQPRAVVVRRPGTRQWRCCEWERRGTAFPSQALPTDRPLRKPCDTWTDPGSSHTTPDALPRRPSGNGGEGVCDLQAQEAR